MALLPNLAGRGAGVWAESLAVLGDTSEGVLTLLMGVGAEGVGDERRFPLPLPFCLAAAFLGEGSDKSLVCVGFSLPLLFGFCF